MIISPKLSEFPPEVVLHILDLTAQESTASCLTICLISSWCLRMALPHLFATAVVLNEAKLKEFRRLLLGEWDGDLPLSLRLQSPGFRPSSFVRHLWMQDFCVGGSKMLEACSHLEYAALTQQFFFRLNAASAFRPHLKPTADAEARSLPRRLRLLILDTDDRWNLGTRIYSDSLNFCREITHLQLANPVPYNANTLNLDSFSRLTHFAVPFKNSGECNLEELTKLLERKSFEMLVVILHRETTDGDARRLACRWLKDTRRTHSTVCLVEISQANLRNEWEQEARGGQSIWDRAIEYTLNIVQE